MPLSSTGPRTPEGKKTSAINALRHGLTGRVVVLPSEDMDAYHAFCAELIADLAPETPVERQYAQTFCDTQWRLNRARSKEAQRALSRGAMQWRNAARQAALDAAVLLRNLHKMKHQSYDPAIDQSTNQFVFSTGEIEAEARLQYRRADAQNAKSFNYDLAA